jgi:hypothetical protein
MRFMASSTSANGARLAFYGFGCVLGALSTWYFNLRFIEAHGGVFALSPFLSEAFANDAAGSLGADILVAGLIGVPFMIFEGRRLGMRHLWLYPVLTGTIAFAAAFPLFLLMRELRLTALARESRAREPESALAWTSGANAALVRDRVAW